LRYSARPSARLRYSVRAPTLNEPHRTFAHHQHIVLEHVSKRFGVKDVLRDITLVVPRGQTTVILGGSGAGKTTLLRLLIALDRPSSGHIYVDGEDITQLDEVRLNEVRRKFGMVFQYAALLDSLTVLENVAFPLREHTKLSSAEIRREVSERLRLLGLQGTEKLYPSQLSGGMRKRVGIARALMLKPQILIYDEPTSGLDPTTSRMVDDLIEQMREQFHVTSLVISHDIASCIRIAHQAILLIHGEIVARGTPDDLANGDSEAARDFFAKSGVALDAVPARLR